MFSSYYCKSLSVDYEYMKLLLYLRVIGCAQVIGEVVLVQHMLLEAVWRLIEIFLADTAYEATTLHVGAHLLDLVTQLAERVNDQTCGHILVMKIVIEF